MNQELKDYQKKVRAITHVIKDLGRDEAETILYLGSKGYEALTNEQVQQLTERQKLTRDKGAIISDIASMGITQVLSVLERLEQKGKIQTNNSIRRAGQGPILPGLTETGKRDYESLRQALVTKPQKQ